MRKNRKRGGRRTKRTQRGGGPDLWTGDGFGLGGTGYSWLQLPQPRRWTEFAESHFGGPSFKEPRWMIFSGGKKTRKRKSRKRIR